MNDRQYLKHMLDLTVRLTKACEDDGYGSDAYNEVLVDIANFAVKFNNSRRRQAWYHLASIVVLACVLAWGFYLVLQLLKI